MKQRHEPFTEEVPIFLNTPPAPGTGEYVVGIRCDGSESWDLERVSVSKLKGLC